ncbi:DNA-binding protein [Trypanosoma rangeli]|uniref:DNA-binding protein n=1 Tax=Trypanosoma rangeli TaxID=5698 RepID=A0A422NVW8_TRYRA|nr:DNA-binding protein [Trypanosoma rangeli]RNF09600.1 DNA-binding protein [Trypanosoma rangeli]|eukprot:RNF09600.1 DNA-binding protein [Trypanosoma rangeli]
MTDIISRVERLKNRIRVKREEVHRHLDASFYRQCRSVLRAVMKHDENGIFASNPAVLPEYVLMISRPMWWKLISRRLDNYEYANKMEFVRDMRLVMDNCYAYNGDASPVATLGRRLEVVMEDLFVTELAVAPPDAREIITLGKGVTHAQARQLWDIVCRYEGEGQGTSAVRRHIVPSQLKCATQRRVVAFLRHKKEVNEQAGRSGKASAAHQQRQTLPRPVKPQAPPQPTRSLLEDDADVSFSADQKVTPKPPQGLHLERVPQNKRLEFTSFRPVSPIHLESSDAGDAEEGKGEV